MLESLANKIVVVTGASSGLGEALARGFAENAATTYLLARRKERLEAIAQELVNKGHKAYAQQCDVTDWQDIWTAANRVTEEQGRIDIWVNNAGWNYAAGIFELTPDLVRHITEVNSYGLIFGTMISAKHMKEQKSGDIVQILSTSAFFPRSKEPVYAGAKADGEHFSASIRDELKQYGIRMIRVFPGGLDTDFRPKANLEQLPNLINPNEAAQLILTAVAQPRNIILDLTIYRGV